jgi:ribosomal protein S18 acetylase RimI-like enzyme
MTAQGARTAQIRRLVPGDWAALRAVRLAALAEAPYAFASTLDRELAFDEQAWRDRISRTAHVGAWAPSPGQPASDKPAGDRPTTGELAAGDLAAGGLAAVELAGAGGLAGLAAGFPDDAGWHLVSMWVSPALRGRGTAADLVEAVCALARADGAGQIALWVTEVNARARAFYERAGFRETGERALVRPDEPDHWERRMVRDLRPG